MLCPVGFGEDEGMLPYPRRSFLGYRLLQEYFTFPYKFFFFDLGGLDRLASLTEGNTAEVVFLLGPLEGPDRDRALARFVSKDTIRLGCTPVVNLFEGESEPIRLNQRRTGVHAPGPRVEGVSTRDLLRGPGGGGDVPVPPGEPPSRRSSPIETRTGVTGAVGSGTNGVMPAAGFRGEPRT